MKSELCKSCVHTNVCGKDKNLVGDAFVLGDPMFFDNRELYRKYKEREEAGFPCDDYLMECKPEKMTRADRIRNLNDEDLARYLSNVEMYAHVHGVKNAATWLQRLKQEYVP